MLRLRRAAIALTIFASVLVLVATTPMLAGRVQEKRVQVKVTFYGYPDNDDGEGHFNTDVIRGLDEPRRENAKGDPIAGGNGSYSNPITCAVSEGNKLLKIGDIVYIPHLKKYFIVEDECGSCETDAWIDVWMNSDAKSDRKAVEDCESRWTGDDRVKRAAWINPAKDLEVDPTPFFDTKAGRCCAP